MNTTKKVRLGVIGVGGMGSCHVRDIANSSHAQLAAVCDINPERATTIANQYAVPSFTDYQELLAKAELDGVVIATPHYDHTPISIAALRRGIHTLVEKPVAVHVNDAQKMISAYQQAKTVHPDLVFAIMFQMRTYGFWQKIKNLIDEGELGRLVRATWIITCWFRSQTYYDNGGWRATWKGEGGGVLLNQCPHNLDIYQWLCGMPKRVTGFASIGKYHHIEVEDEVTGYFEFEDGMVGHFITTTAECPGSDRLEIVGEKGKLVVENGKILFYRNRSSMLDFIRTSPTGFDQVENWAIEIPYEKHTEIGHRIVIENFVDAIATGSPVFAPAEEGIRSLGLGNAIMLSSFLQRPVDLPLDGDAYEALLQRLIRESNFQKDVREVEVSDFNKSFHK